MWGELPPSAWRSLVASTSGTFGVRVVMDPKGLADLLRGPNGPVYRRLIQDGELVKQRAKQECPVFTSPDPYTMSHRDRAPGTLKNSIVKRVVVDTDGGPAVLVGSEDKVALWVHEGTVPHPIVARKAPRLVFYWPKGPRGAGVYSFLRVNHPGTQPNRFLIRALTVLRGRY